MTVDRGDFRVSRAVFNHPALSGDPYDRRSAWLSLIADAAWSPRIINRAGRIIRLERGQLAASHRFLSEKWAWEHKRVARFLETLVALDMIRTHVVSGVGVLTITNYELYQGTNSDRNKSTMLPGHSRGSDAPQNGAVNGADTGAVENYDNASLAAISAIGHGDSGAVTGTVNGAETPQGLAENRGKTYKHTQRKKESKNSSMPATKMVANSEIGKNLDEWWSCCSRKVGKKPARVEYTPIVRKGEATVAELLAGIKAYAAECAGKEPQFIKHPLGWLRAGRWADERATAPSDGGQALIDYWREKIENFKRDGKWPPSFGPPPGQAGCRVPVAVQQQFGFRRTDRPP